MHDSVTVSAADVARLAGVGRAAVSNWRRRYEDFPEPVGGTASSPLFSLFDIEGWLRSQGKLMEEVPSEERLWQRIRATAGDLRLAETVADVGAFLLYLEQAPREWTDLAARTDSAVADHLQSALAAGLADLPGSPFEPSAPDFVAVVREVADLAAEWGPARTFEFLCGRYLEAHSRWAATTPAEMADLMAALAQPRRGVVLDPACGTGTLLLACLPYRPSRLAGQEIEVPSARIAAIRLLLAPDVLPDVDAVVDTATDGVAGTAADATAGTAADVTADVAAGDSLRDDAFPGLRADAVLCDPPFNERGWGYEELAGDPRWEFGLPPRGEPELAWVQHALARTHPGGRVVMLMPSAVASRRSGRRLRAELLRTGALRAVVALPAGAAPLSTAAPHLWVLRRPDRGDRLPSHVLMVDVSDPGSTWGEVHKTVVRSWRSYVERTGEPVEDHDVSGQPGITAYIPLIDLLDEDIDLTPARRLPRRAPAAGTQFAATRDRVAGTVAELARTIPELDVSGGAPGDASGEAPGDASGDASRDAVALTATSQGTSPVTPPMTSVGEQSKAGTLAVHHSALRMDSQDGELPALTAEDVTLGRAPTGRVRDQAGHITLRAGDIVMPVVTRRVVARVISDEEGVLGPHLVLVRADPERFDPDFLAGFLRLSGRGSATRTQSGSSRIDVRKARFPRVPLDEQRRYGDAFRRITAWEDTLRTATTVGEELVRAALDGLGDGSLRPGR